MEIITSKDKTYHEVTGGHLGMLAGKTATDTWEYIAQWLMARPKAMKHKVKKAVSGNGNLAKVNGKRNGKAAYRVKR